MTAEQYIVHGQELNGAWHGADMRLVLEGNERGARH